MENKNLMLMDLTVQEILELSSFVKTIKYFNLDDRIYHYGTYRDESICVTKNNKNKWEVYVIERGNINNKLTFSSCFFACLELLRYSADSNGKYIELMNYYGKEVIETENKLKQIEGKEIIPEVNNHLLKLKK